MATREDSVLTSLRSLRGIEDDRKREEEQQARLREEQARQAVAEAERLRRADAERIVREAEEAKRAELERRERDAREAQLRLDEAERKARVEAQMKLEESRLKMEIEAQAVHGSKKKPTGLYALAAVLVLAVGGLGVFAYQKQQENARNQAQIVDAKKKLGELEVINKQLIAKQEELATASDDRKRAIEADIQRLKDEQAAKEKEAAAAGANVPRPRPPVARPKPPVPVDTHIPMCPPEKPICKDSEKR